MPKYRGYVTGERVIFVAQEFVIDAGSSDQARQLALEQARATTRTPEVWEEKGLSDTIEIDEANTGVTVENDDER